MAATWYVLYFARETEHIEGRKSACALKLRSHTGHVSSFWTAGFHESNGYLGWWSSPAFFGFSSFSLDVYYIDSSPREPRFVLVPLRFASEAWPRAGLGEPRSASNANKPASSWPLKQGRKKWSKHGCDRETSTVRWLVPEASDRGIRQGTSPWLGPARLVTWWIARQPMCRFVQAPQSAGNSATEIPVMAGGIYDDPILWEQHNGPAVGRNGCTFMQLWARSLDGLAIQWHLHHWWCWSSVFFLATAVGQWSMWPMLQFAGLYVPWYRNTYVQIHGWMIQLHRLCGPLQL